MGRGLDGSIETCVVHEQTKEKGSSLDAGTDGKERTEVTVRATDRVQTRTI